MDVAHPGQTPPAENSKSVIITKRAVVQDSTVVADETKTDEEPQKLASVSHQKTIQPLSAPVEAAPEPETPKSVEPESTPESEIPAASFDEPELAGDKGGVSPQAEQARLDEQQAERDASTQKLITDKQFYLPITSSEQRRSKRTLAIGLVVSVFLAAAWFNVALDAGIIAIDGVEPLVPLLSK